VTSQADRQAAVSARYAKLAAADRACDAARAAANAQADAQPGINPAFVACTGERGTPTMDTSLFHAVAAGECGGSLGWGDDLRIAAIEAQF
jgi:hypothetical protein